MTTEITTTKLEGGLRGVDHVAYPTWKPEETVHFYRDVLGFPLAHCILAPGWGNDPHPDFVHFFFDIGAGARLAFFYYFGVEPYEDPNVPDRIKTGAAPGDARRHRRGARRTTSAGSRRRASSCASAIMHELIESIYVWDPNGYSIEISRKLRPLTEADAVDTELSIQALIDVCGARSRPSPRCGSARASSSSRSWQVEPWLASSSSTSPSTSRSGSARSVTASSRSATSAPTSSCSFPDGLTIDRVATGVRHAVWYSGVGALKDARVVQFDKDALRVVARACERADPSGWASGRGWNRGRCPTASQTSVTVGRDARRSVGARRPLRGRGRHHGRDPHAPAPGPRRATHLIPILLEAGLRGVGAGVPDGRQRPHARPRRGGARRRRRVRAPARPGLRPHRGVRALRRRHALRVLRAAGRAVPPEDRIRVTPGGKPIAPGRGDDAGSPTPWSSWPRTRAG